MPLPSFALQAAMSATPTESFVVSGAALLAAGAAIWRGGVMAGRFTEFKETTDREREERKRESATAITQNSDNVKRHELATLSEHIDRRFDEMGRQLAEIRTVGMRSAHVGPPRATD